MTVNKWRTKYPSHTGSNFENACIKCQKCGVPRRGHFDKKSRQEKTKLMAERAKFPIATYQIAAVYIQKHARAFIALMEGVHVILVNIASLYTDLPQLLKYKIYGGSIAGNNSYSLLLDDGRQDNLLIPLLDAMLVGSLRNHPDLNKTLTFRIDGSMSPPLIVYKSLENTKLLNGDCRDSLQSEVYINYPELVRDTMEHKKRTPWNIVDPEKMAAFICKELKKMRELSKRKKERNSRLSKTKGSTQLKREKIRKKSQLKWKWFYDGHLDHNAPTLNDGEGKLNTNDEDCTEDVLAWLDVLDLNAQKYDIDIDDG
ncbi:hypothetical protein HJC23_005713 [Cyclotella cryptica]|uniref:Uncharacterized protein n=1 Tax=Cyclotella cryptica TaxID=29204 RepID=A0ABD3QDG0_9STRA